MSSGCASGHRVDARSRSRDTTELTSITEGGRDVAWDFSTEPEFEEQLEWMRDVRARGDLADRGDRARHRPGRARPHQRAAAGAGQGAGPVGRAPAAGARRPGLRPGQARPDERDPRHLDLRAATSSAARRPTPATARSSRSPGHREQKERWLLPAARRRAPLGVLDDRAGDAGLGPDAAPHARRPRRRRLRPRRATSGSPRTARSRTSSIVMAVTDPDAPPHERASMFLVPVDDARV